MGGDLGRTKFHDTADGIEIEIAPARDKLALLGAISAMFTVGIAVTVHGLLTGTGFGAPGRHGPPPTMFLTFWVLGAACGVGAMLRKIVWILGGREAISLSGRGLRVERSDPLWRVVRTFDVADVSALRVGEPPEKLPANRASLGLGRHGVAFDHRGRSEGFGLDLDADDAREVVERLQAALQARGASRDPGAPAGASWIRETREGLEIEILARRQTRELWAGVSGVGGAIVMMVLARTEFKHVLPPGPFSALWFGILGLGLLSSLRRLHWHLRGREILRLTRDGLAYERRGELPSRWHVALEAAGAIALREPPVPGPRGLGSFVSLGEPRVEVAGKLFGVSLDVSEARVIVERIARTRAALLGTRGFRDGSGADPAPRTAP